MVIRRIAVVAFTAGLLVAGISGTASANQPKPPTCWSSATNNGQEAQLALSSIAGDSSPGLSGYDVGGFTIAVQSDVCGLH